MVECRTPEREVRGSRPTVAVLCPWARHFTPRKYWLITQEAMAPSRHDWKIVDWDVKPQHNQPNILSKQLITKVLIRLRGCSGWSVPLLFTYDIKVFSWHGSYSVGLQIKCGCDWGNVLLRNGLWKKKWQKQWLWRKCTNCHTNNSYW